MKLLFFGDIVGKSGRELMKSNLGRLVRKHSPDVVIANGENAAGGLGLDPSTAEEIYGAGVDIITSGNHIWKKKEIGSYLDSNTHRLLRPENYPAGAPGVGSLRWKTPSGFGIRVINLLGRVFIPDLVDCPFHSANQLLEEAGAEDDFVIVDFHAEATSEKAAMAYHLDGRVDLVVGTHTHVQTADERILPGGTAFISDLGMCGPADGVIGVKRELIVERFLSGRPTKFEVAKGRGMINAILLEIDSGPEKTKNISRINEFH